MIHFVAASILIVLYLANMFRVIMSVGKTSKPKVVAPGDAVAAVVVCFLFAGLVLLAVAR